MSEVMIITSDDPDEPIIYVDRDGLTAGDKIAVDIYLDAVEYMLNPQDHPDRFSTFTVEDFQNVQIGGHTLQTDEDKLFALAQAGDLDDLPESHSL